MKVFKTTTANSLVLPTVKASVGSLNINYEQVLFVAYQMLTNATLLSDLSYNLYTDDTFASKILLKKISGFAANSTYNFFLQPTQKSPITSTSSAILEGTVSTTDIPHSSINFTILKYLELSLTQLYQRCDMMIYYL